METQSVAINQLPGNVKALCSRLSPVPDPLCTSAQAAKNNRKPHRLLWQVLKEKRQFALVRHSLVLGTMMASLLLINVNIQAQIPCNSSFNSPGTFNGIAADSSSEMTIGVTVYSKATSRLEIDTCDICLLEMLPNPFEGRGLVRFAISEMANVDLRIVNQQGYTVTTLYRGAMKGSRALFYKNSESLLPNGTYYLLMKASFANGNTASRVVPIRRLQ